MSNLYPFQTKGQIKILLQDSEYRKAAIVQLFQKQTEHEQATSTTLNKNKVGFMSSHAVHGTRIAKMILAGEVLTEEDLARVDSIAPRYTRQLATFARARAIAENPALAETARLFSADRIPALPEEEIVPEGWESVEGEEISEKF